MRQCSRKERKDPSFRFFLENHTETLTVRWLLFQRTQALFPVYTWWFMNICSTNIQFQRIHHSSGLRRCCIHIDKQTDMKVKHSDTF